MLTLNRKKMNFVTPVTPFYIFNTYPKLHFHSWKTAAQRGGAYIGKGVTPVTGVTGERK
jgi:hypothetical protein